MWEYLERTGTRKEADACILRVKCMLDGQCAGILPLKGTAFELHWNARACIGGLSKPGNFQGAPAGQSRVAASAAGSVPGESVGSPTNQG